MSAKFTLIFVALMANVIGQSSIWLAASVELGSESNGAIKDHMFMNGTTSKNSQIAIIDTNNSIRNRTNATLVQNITSVAINSSNHSEGRSWITGIVKFFNRTKHFGFIAGDDGKDYFVHSDGLMAGTSIGEGDRVRFFSAEGNKGPKAINVERIVSNASTAKSNGNNDLNDTFP